jgi:hypothetical protein
MLGNKDGEQMKRIIKYLVIINLFLIILINTKVYATNVTDYLILGDITPYQRITQVKDIYTKQYKTILGYWINDNAGVLAGPGTVGRP